MSRIVAVDGRGRALETGFSLPVSTLIGSEVLVPYVRHDLPLSLDAVWPLSGLAGLGQASDVGVSSARLAGRLERWPWQEGAWARQGFSRFIGSLVLGKSVETGLPLNRRVCAVVL